MSVTLGILIFGVTLGVLKIGVTLGIMVSHKIYS